MKKSFALVLAFIVVISSAFAACSSKKNDDTKESTTTTASGLEGAQTDYGIETDENGNEVNVVYEKDKEGNTVAYVIDEKGEKTTDKKGEKITIKSKTTTTKKTTAKKSDKSTTKKSDTTTETPTTAKETTTEKPTATTAKDAQTTDKELTTMPSDKDKVPLTSATGTVVAFSVNDQQIIAKMLEVPGITGYSYENKDGVSAQLATHVAVWMAQREDLSSTTYPSGTVVLDLFKYFGQTVVNFKSDCNDAATKSTAPISYDAKNDTFNIAKAEKKDQTVVIEKIESLGNNNYYKVTAKVSGVKNISGVTAIVQKNRLDSSLGFSIKALKWAK